MIALGSKRWRHGQIGDQGGEVAVVDLDDVGADGFGPGQVGFVEDLGHGFQAGVVGQVQHLGELGIGEQAHDEQQGRGPGRGRGQHLERVDEEVLAQKRQAGRAHGFEVVEGALEVDLLGQHRDGGGAGGGVHGRHRFRRKSQVDVALGRGGPLVLGDDGDGRLGEQGVGKRRPPAGQGLGQGLGRLKGLEARDLGLFGAPELLKHGARP